MGGGGGFNLCSGAKFNRTFIVASEEYLVRVCPETHHGKRAKKTAIPTETYLEV